MPSVNDRQVGGSHYKDSAHGVCPHCRGEVQMWDWACCLPALAYAATKYIARHRSKGGRQDLEKAKQYIDKIIEQEYPDVVRAASGTYELGGSGASADDSDAPF